MNSPPCSCLYLLTYNAEQVSHIDPATSSVTEKAMRSLLCICYIKLSFIWFSSFPPDRWAFLTRTQPLYGGLPSFVPRCSKAERVGIVI